MRTDSYTPVSPMVKERGLSTEFKLQTPENHEDLLKCVVDADPTHIDRMAISQWTNYRNKRVKDVIESKVAATILTPTEKDSKAKINLDGTESETDVDYRDVSEEERTEAVRLWAQREGDEYQYGAIVRSIGQAKEQKEKVESADRTKAAAAADPDLWQRLHALGIPGYESATPPTVE